MGVDNLYILDNDDDATELLQLYINLTDDEDDNDNNPASDDELVHIDSEDDFSNSSFDLQTELGLGI